MYPTIPLTNIKQRSGPNQLVDWEEMGKNLMEAHNNQCGIVVDVPEGVDPENFRHAAQIALFRVTGYKVGLTKKFKKFHIWSKK